MISYSRNHGNDNAVRRCLLDKNYMILSRKSITNCSQKVNGSFPPSSRGLYLGCGRKNLHHRRAGDRVRIICQRSLWVYLLAVDAVGMIEGTVNASNTGILLQSAGEMMRSP